LFFKQVHKQYYGNIMSGSFAGLPVSLFDYRDNIGRKNFPLTVVAFSHDLRLPMFQLLPNNPFLPTLMREAGANVHAIVFDSYPDFSRRSLLIGAPEDEAELRMLFSPSLLAFLAGLPPQELWSVQNDGVHLILHEPSIVRTRDLRAFLETSSSIAKTFLDSRSAITAGQISASSKSSGIDGLFRDRSINRDIGKRPVFSQTVNSRVPMKRGSGSADRLRHQIDKKFLKAIVVDLLKDVY
jgi:hypothetical protein